jgi:polynucleotide 5'-hydroxyl-kinase GRC3/NOL9
MNRTIEGGKTLLVDGPACVTATSGKVEVFGFPIEISRKIVVREGKRLPFAVVQTADFDVSLAEIAKIEEADGNTIPQSWIKSCEELLNLQERPATAMVFGTIDSGKTSFCTYLVNRLLFEKQKVAILDGDLGQSDIGPPCTVAYTFVTRPVIDLFNLQAENAFFVGVTSPNEAITRTIEGLSVLKKEIWNRTPDFVVVNTDGWVEGEDAIRYKVQLAEVLKPDMVFCIQREDELAPLTKSLESFKKSIVDSPTTLLQRSREKRKILRELGYVKYLKNAKAQSLPIRRLKIEENGALCLGKKRENGELASEVSEVLGMEPLHFAEWQDKLCIVIGKKRSIDSDSIEKIEERTNKKVVIVRKGEEEGLLLALNNSQGKFLGIGVLREIDYSRKFLKIFTPVSGVISGVVLGKVKLDENFREIQHFKDKNESIMTSEQP